MNILIAYASKHGTAEKCAKELGGRLKGDVTFYDLKSKQNIDLSKYSHIVIGGSIYVGQIQKEVKAFCSENLSQLIDKNIGLFISCMDDGEAAGNYIINNFPAELKSKAITTEVLGGGFIFSKMNFFERFIIKMVSKNKNNGEAIDTKKDVLNISQAKLDSFAQIINNSMK